MNEFFEIFYNVAYALIKAGVRIVKTGIETVGESIEQKIKEYHAYTIDVNSYNYNDWFSREETIARIRDYIITNMGGPYNVVSFSKYYAKRGEGFEFVFYDLSKVNYHKLKNYAKVWVSDSRESIVLMPKNNENRLEEILYITERTYFD